MRRKQLSISPQAKSDRIPRVLVALHIPSLHQAVCTRLRDRGFIVVAADEATTACERAGLEAFDLLVISDASSHHGVLAALRRLHRDTPVVLLRDSSPDPNFIDPHVRGLFVPPFCAPGICAMTQTLLPKPAEVLG